jgi:hypothetical protein
MVSQVLTLDLSVWQVAKPQPVWISALEADQMLYFPRLAFALQP